MITWQGVVDASQISGTAVGHSNAKTIINSRTEAATYDWFGGNIAASYEVEPDFGFLLEDWADVSIDDDGTTYTFLVDKGGTTNNGQFTNSGYSIIYVYPYNGLPTIGDPQPYQDEGGDSNWSRSEVNLATYSLTTLSNQTGRTTTQIATQEQRPTTTLVGGNTTTTNSAFDISRTTTTLVTDSTIATWQSSTYDTVFVTGQTTVKMFSSFSNEVPIVYSESASQVSTVDSTIERLSFVGVQTYADTIDTTMASHSFTATNIAWTSTTQGSLIDNITNPQIEAGGTKATIANRFNFLESTAETNADGVFTTTSTHTVLKTSKELNFADTTVAATYASTTTAGSVTNGVNTQITYSVTGITHTQDGSFELVPTHLFKTERAAEIIAVENVTIGVRAVSDGNIGAGIDANGQGQKFSLHTTSVVFPVTAITQKSGSRFTYSLNSYTVKDSAGNTSTSTFDVTGDSTNQHMTIATTQSFVQTATVLGGAIEGHALVGNGVYRTFNSAGEGTTSVTEPIEVAWSASAATTAWMPALRAETAVHSTEVFGASLPTNVTAISRHSFTQILDE